MDRQKRVPPDISINVIHCRSTPRENILHNVLTIVLWCDQAKFNFDNVARSGMVAAYR